MELENAIEWSSELQDKVKQIQERWIGYESGLHHYLLKS